jgi:glycosyltransferase involved in cell wall biosynthesis
MLGDDPQRDRAGGAGRAVIGRDFGFRRYVFDLLSATSDPPPRVSVVVPNYNYRDYLQQRLASIVAQSVPVYEVIVLDDASTDGSSEWLETDLYKLFPEAQLIVNDANSGSVFRQWLTGVRLARGEFVWIAEADDLAESSFIEVALRGFSDPEVVLSYTQSKQIDGAGNVLANDYRAYVADISRERWAHQYVASGLAEIREALAIKNTIPNVSGVLFRREPLLAVLSRHIDELVQYKVAGDWATYVELLDEGRVAFSPESLNLHRRHDTSVTLSRFDLSQLMEIMRVQKQVRDRFELDHGVRARAAAYAQELYEQFGLASKSHPSVGEHPDLAPLL